MKTGKYELVVLWASGDRDIYIYPDKESAVDGQEGMRIALGNQISWSCIRPQLA